MIETECRKTCWAKDCTTWNYPLPENLWLKNPKVTRDLQRSFWSVIYIKRGIVNNSEAVEEMK